MFSSLNILYLKNEIKQRPQCLDEYSRVLFSISKSVSDSYKLGLFFTLAGLLIIIYRFSQG